MVQALAQLLPVEEDTASKHPACKKREQTDDDLAWYLQEEPLDPSANPLKWWQDKMQQLIWPSWQE